MDNNEPPNDNYNQYPNPPSGASLNQSAKFETTPQQGYSPSPQLPSVQPAPIQAVEAEKPKSGAGKIILFVVMFFVILVLGLTFVGGYLLAYDKITLTKYPELQTKIAAIVMSIPFTPKTPRYVLIKATDAQNKLTSQSFDASLAVSSSGGYNPFGSIGGIDGQAKGYVDFSDPNNIEFNMNVSATKDINLDLTKIGQIFYFRINTIEGQVKALLDSVVHLDYSFLGQWYRYDSTSLQTDARKSLQDKEQESVLKEYTDKSLDVFDEQQILKRIVLTKEKLNGEPTFKLELKIDEAMLDEIATKLTENNNPSTYATTKLSDTVKNMESTLWVDEKTYNIRRTDVRFDIKPPASTYSPYGSLPFTSGTTSFAFSSSFSDFNEKQELTAPNNAIDYLELLRQIDTANPGL